DAEREPASLSDGRCWKPMRQEQVLVVRVGSESCSWGSEAGRFVDGEGEGLRGHDGDVDRVDGEVVHTACAYRRGPAHQPALRRVLDRYPARYIVRREASRPWVSGRRKRDGRQRSDSERGTRWRCDYIRLVYDHGERLRRVRSDAVA